jgi:hypothetical protein
MKVVAIKNGFHEVRRRIGARFDLPESAMKKDKDGKPVLPSWVVLASGDGAKQAQAARKADEERMLQGALAAAGKAVKVSEVGEKVIAEDLSKLV